MDKYYLTKERAEELKKELEMLKGQKRLEVADRLRVPPRTLREDLRVRIFVLVRLPACHRAEDYVVLFDIDHDLLHMAKVTLGCPVHVMTHHELGLFDWHDG